MVLTFLALAFGLVAGLRLNHRPRHVAPPAVRAFWLLIGGIGAQFLGEATDSVAVILLSYVLLLGFAAVNLGLVGVPVVMLGLGLNALTLAVNGGMPVRASAVEAAGQAEDGDLADVDLGAARHFERGDDRLTSLGDVIPLSWMHQVLSFGDLILLVGVADVAAHLVRRSAARDREVDGLARIDYESVHKSLKWGSPPTDEYRSGRVSERMAVSNGQSGGSA
jgi:hypothetical protein